MIQIVHPSGIKVALEESAEVLKWRTFECVVASCRWLTEKHKTICWAEAAEKQISLFCEKEHSGVKTALLKVHLTLEGQCIRYVSGDSVTGPSQTKYKQQCWFNWTPAVLSAACHTQENTMISGSRYRWFELRLEWIGNALPGLLVQ